MNYQQEVVEGYFLVHHVLVFSLCEMLIMQVSMEFRSR